MNIHIRNLAIRTRRTTEQINFSEVVTFLHGPVSTGKSTVTRLIDYCLGGDLERTPAIQREFISAELSLVIWKLRLQTRTSSGRHSKCTGHLGGPRG